MQRLGFLLRDFGSYSKDSNVVHGSVTRELLFHSEECLAFVSWPRSLGFDTCRDQHQKRPSYPIIVNDSFAFLAVRSRTHHQIRLIEPSPSYHTPKYHDTIADVVSSSSGGRGQ